MIKMFGQRQAIGILGMIFAIMLWGAAGIILLKLNKKNQKRSKR